MTKTSQILKTVGKTINLAKPQVYQVPRKPPLNSLVFEKLPEPRCGDRIAVNKSSTPKPVRVCTKEELQALYCCPSPCDCKCTKGHRTSTSEKLGTLIKTAVKIWFIKKLIEYTWREGLWSDAFHSSCFLGKFINYCPVAEEEPMNEYSTDELVIRESEPCMPFIPRSSVMLYEGTVLWNKMWKMVFWLLLHGPGELWDFFANIFGGDSKVKPDPCDKILNRKVVF